MSNIEWTERTWNPVVGCTPVSPGCLNCYAATMAIRLEAMGKPEYQPIRRDTDGRDVTVTPGLQDESDRVVRIAEVRGDRAVFTGDVRTVQSRLTAPLGWRKPQRVFVNSMSDLFHESVPFAFIDRVFAVMALCPQHTFQVLTKRPERMAAYLDGLAGEEDVNGSIGMQRLGNAAGMMLDGEWVWNEGKRHRGAIERFISDAYGEDDEDSGYEAKELEWPLPNVWLGTSVEDQARAEERIPQLLKCPAAVRFLSCEPLLGVLDLKDWIGGACDCAKTNGIHSNFCAQAILDRGGVAEGGKGGRLHWVIVGGESGPNSRRCDLGWVRSIVRQCDAAGVPCFVKQLGLRASDPINGIAGAGLRVADEAKELINLRLKDRKGGDVAEWPDALRVREYPTVVGKAKLF